MFDIIVFSEFLYLIQNLMSRKVTVIFDYYVHFIEYFLLYLFIFSLFSQFSVIILYFVM